MKKIFLAVSILPSLGFAKTLTLRGEIGLRTIPLIMEIKNMQQGSHVNLVIESPGGEVNMAGVLAQALDRVHATCYVKVAASAALQIVMPHCDVIIASEQTQLGFHAAHLSGFISLKELEEVEGMLTQIDSAMAKNMRKAFGKFICPTEAQKWERLTKDCLRGALHEELVWDATTWNAHWTGGKRIVVIPSTMFNEVIK